ncbi:MAG: pyridoxal 5'-phosphate synthase glutaminase subunit PdxT [Acidobacteriota bacterium]|nr:pyridoxal 5'-phosphate synthase glutaminase subunit PdxT [Acidobacteriota bacterium]
MRVGVLALQGDVREHAARLASMGVPASRVRRPEDLEGLGGLVIPGGESTAIAHLLETSGLRAPLASALGDGLAVLGTCAGLILLAETILDGRDDQWSYGAIDVAVRRNGYGRQVASFESTVRVAGVGEVPGVFIRAPRVEQWAPGVEVLATIDHGDGEHPVLVRQGAALGCAFHPELTGDTAIHQLFLDTIG